MAQSMATVGANGDVGGPQSGPGPEELPSVERCAAFLRQGPATLVH